MPRKTKSPAPRLNGDLDGLIAKLKKSMNDTIAEVEIVFDSATGAVEELKELRAITQRSIDTMEAFLSVVETDFTIKELTTARDVMRSSVDHIQKDFNQTKAKRAALLPPSTPNPPILEGDKLHELLFRLSTSDESMTVEDILILNPHMSYEEALSFLPEVNKPGGLIPVEPIVVKSIQKSGWRDKLGDLADRIRERLSK
jgi:hypothetical protein